MLEAADQLDRYGNKKARGIISMAKVYCPYLPFTTAEKTFHIGCLDDVDTPHLPMLYVAIFHIS